MKTTLIVLAIVAVLAGLVALAAVGESGPVPAVHRSVVVDASDSVWCRSARSGHHGRGRAGAGQRSCVDVHRCEEVTALGVGGLGSGALPYTVELLATGENQDGGASRELGEASYTPQGGLLHGRDQAARARKAFAAKVAGFCASIQDTRTSPILEAIRAAVSDLGQYPCGAPGVDCEVAVRSDGEENGDQALMARLAGTAKGPVKDPIDLSHIQRVLFCGLHARVVAQRRHGHALSLDQVEKVWREAFTDPRKVTFLANCPR